MAEVASSDAGDRGTLTIEDNVLTHVAEIAALESVHVAQRTTATSMLTGRSLPRASVRLAGERVRADVEVSVGWPVSLSAAAQDVSTRVGQALAHTAGVVVDAVDVTITHIAYAEATPERRVQ